MLKRIMIAGAGGQGIVSLGKIIARLAAANVPHVTFFPAYGAEVRGGASYCEVILSDHEIPSPCAEAADLLVLMNAHSAAELLARLTPEGTAIVNSSLCPLTAADDRRIIAVPASALADKAGNPRSANLVLLGVIQRHSPIFDNTAVEAAIRKAFADHRPETLAANLRAFQAGLSTKP